MRRRTRLAASAACGIAAFACAATGVSSVQAEARAAEERVLVEFGGDRIDVCVATADLDQGSVVGEADVETRSWASTMLPTDAVTSLDEAVGRQTTSSVPAGAVLSERYFERPDDALEVPSGLVAVSVPSKSQLAIGGALRRGDAVDVYVSDGNVTDLLIGGAKVIDLSTEGAGSSEALDWVTIAVEPERVVDVLSATAHGSISLTLPAAGAEADADPAGDTEGGERP